MHGKLLQAWFAWLGVHFYSFSFSVNENCHCFVFFNLILYTHTVNSHASCELKKVNLGGRDFVSPKHMICPWNFVGEERMKSRNWKTLCIYPLWITIWELWHLLCTLHPMTNYHELWLMMNGCLDHCWSHLRLNVTEQKSDYVSWHCAGTGVELYADP